MSSDKSNHFLSNEVYKVGNNELEIKKGIEIKVENENEKYKVLAVENNKNNGMQAMAVAPVDSNGKVEIF